MKKHTALRFQPILSMNSTIPQLQKKVKPRNFSFLLKWQKHSGDFIMPPISVTLLLHQDEDELAYRIVMGYEQSEQCELLAELSW